MPPCGGLKHTRPLRNLLFRNGLILRIILPTRLLKSASQKPLEKHPLPIRQGGSAPVISDFERELGVKTSNKRLKGHHEGEISWPHFFENSSRLFENSPWCRKNSMRIP